MDLAGGLAAALGTDNQGRSLTASLDGGVELSIGRNKQNNSLQLDLDGDLNVTVKGNYHLNVTGDIVMDSAGFVQITKTDCVRKAQKIVDAALVRHTTEAPDIVHNQGLYESEPDEYGI
jgi:hypothetical protein